LRTAGSFFPSFFSFISKVQPLYFHHPLQVDVLAAEYFTRFAEFGEPDALEAFPHIIALIERVHNLPEIKKHIQERKPTAF
jgi:hypothetical protein